MHRASSEATKFDQNPLTAESERARLHRPSSDRGLRYEWIKACVFGELLGFVPPALVGAFLYWLAAPEALLVAGLVLAGCAEGAILGEFQSRVIKSAFPAVTRWTAATAAAAGIAWLAGMGGSSVVQAAGPLSLLAVVPAWIVGLLAMGVLQSRRLSAAVDASAWIPRTTVAWLIGVAIPVVALSIVPNDAALAVHIAVAVVAAVAMGAIVGVIAAGTLVDFEDQVLHVPLEDKH